MDWSRVHNVLVGTNAIACSAAAQYAEQLGFVSFVLSHDLCGEARQVAYPCLESFGDLFA